MGSSRLIRHLACRLYNSQAKNSINSRDLTKSDSKGMKQVKEEITKVKLRHWPTEIQSISVPRVIAKRGHFAESNCII